MPASTGVRIGMDAAAWCMGSEGPGHPLPTASLPMSPCSPLFCQRTFKRYSCTVQKRARRARAKRRGHRREVTRPPTRAANRTTERAHHRATMLGTRPPDPFEFPAAIVAVAGVRARWPRWVGFT